MGRKLTVYNSYIGLEIDYLDRSEGVEPEHAEGIDVKLDSRSGYVSSLVVDGETAVRLGDLLSAARALLAGAEPGDPGFNYEYARGMAELIGSFAAEDNQYSTDSLKHMLLS